MRRINSCRLSAGLNFVANPPTKQLFEYIKPSPHDPPFEPVWRLNPNNDTSTATHAEQISPNKASLAFPDPLPSQMRARLSHCRAWSKAPNSQQKRRVHTRFLPTSALGRRCSLTCCGKARLDCRLVRFYTPPESKIHDFTMRFGNARCQCHRREIGRGAEAAYVRSRQRGLCSNGPLHPGISSLCKTP